MKRFKSTYLFALVVVGVAGFAWWDYQKSEQEKVIKQTEQHMIPQFDFGAVREIELIGQKDKIKLRHENGKWRIVEPLQADADPDVVDGVLRFFPNEKVRDTGLDVKAVDLERYGLKTPKATIRYVFDDGVKEILVSNKTAYDEASYLLVKGEDTKIVVAQRELDRIGYYHSNDFRIKKFFNAMPEVKAFRVKNNLKNVDVAFERQDDKWQKRGDTQYRVDIEKIGGLITALQAARGLDIVGDKTPSNLKKFGLNHPAITFNFKTAQGEARLDLQKSGDVAYVASSDRQNILKISKPMFEQWNLDSEFLRQKEESRDKK